MPPPLTSAAKYVPSAEDAMDCQERSGALVCVHVTPPLVEAKMYWNAAAASRVPSADEAIEDQFWIGALLCVHVAPPFVEV